MNDWANYIRSKHDEDTRIAEMERKAAPLFWLVYILATVLICWLAVEDYNMRADHDAISAAFAHAANGKPVAIDSMVMSCKLVPRAE